MPKGWNQHTGTNPEINAFIDKAINYDGDDCLIWPFYLLNGRAILSRFQKQYGTQYVSRVICIEVYGPPPTPKHQAAHSIKCISKACINKQHLRWATQSDNFADDRRGEDCSWSILTEEQVLLIRKLNGTMTQREMVTQFGISQKAISRITNYKSWSWLKVQILNIMGRNCSDLGAPPCPYS